jgi:hypothetical protein
MHETWEYLACLVAANLDPRTTRTTSSDLNRLGLLLMEWLERPKYDDRLFSSQSLNEVVAMVCACFSDVFRVERMRY